MTIRPMLAAKADLNSLDFPLFVSPKLDGVRALIVDGVVMSRSMKPIPNEYVQHRFGHGGLNGLDGELIVGPPTAKDVFRRTNSAVMTRDDMPEVRFYVFDYHCEPTLAFCDRLSIAKQMSELSRQPDVHHLSHGRVHDTHHLEAVEAAIVEEGYEGVILRHPDRPYKFGRSTVKEQGMLKLKRFEDSEGEVIEVIELMRNGNAARTNELGYTTRSSHKANLIPAGTMGKLRIRDIHTGKISKVGSGFTAAERDEIWQQRDSTIGRICKYKYFAVGVKDLPRHSVFLGWRSPEDL